MDHRDRARVAALLTISLAGPAGVVRGWAEPAVEPVLEVLSPLVGSVQQVGGATDGVSKLAPGTPVTYAAQRANVVRADGSHEAGWPFAMSFLAITPSLQVSDTIVGPFPGSGLVSIRVLGDGRLSVLMPDESDPAARDPRIAPVLLRRTEVGREIAAKLGFHEPRAFRAGESEFLLSARSGLTPNWIASSDGTIGAITVSGTVHLLQIDRSGAVHGLWRESAAEETKARVELMGWPVLSTDGSALVATKIIMERGEVPTERTLLYRVRVDDGLALPSVETIDGAYRAVACSKDARVVALVDVSRPNSLRFVGTTSEFERWYPMVNRNLDFAGITHRLYASPSGTSRDLHLLELGSHGVRDIKSMTLPASAPITAPRVDSIDLDCTLAAARSQSGEVFVFATSGGEETAVVVGRFPRDQCPCDVRVIDWTTPAAKPAIYFSTTPEGKDRPRVRLFRYST